MFYMNKINDNHLLPASLLLLPVLLAPAQSQAIGGFVEGNIGYNFYNNVGVDLGDDPLFGKVEMDLDYDDEISYGLEVGIRNFDPYDVLRLSVSWDRFDTEVDQGTLSVENGVVISPPGGKFSGSELNDIGFKFDNEIDVYMANLYFDIPLKSAFTPYFGIGLGQADIEHAEDKEFAWKFMLGTNYEFTQNFGLGLRYQYINIEGWEDEFDYKYDDLIIQDISATARYQF